ncbi:MAG: TetR/AcrR family transcriptional regulator [Canibacter sp.]
MTRDRILDAALQCFSRAGYSDTSMKDIAREVGIAAPSIYAHFKNKEALYSATFERSMHEHEQFFRDRLGNTAQLSPTQQLESILTSVPDFYRANPDHFGFHLATANSPQFKILGLQTTFDWLEDRLREAVEKAYLDGVARKDFRVIPAEHFFSFFVCLLDGLYLEMVYYEEPRYSVRLQQVWSSMLSFIQR